VLAGIVIERAISTGRCLNVSSAKDKIVLLGCRKQLFDDLETLRDVSKVQIAI